MLDLTKIEKSKQKLLDCQPFSFSDNFIHYLKKIEVVNFRHIQSLSIDFDHPVTVITGTNKIGKTSVLLLIACSHYNFLRYDSTKPDSQWRRHTWRDVLSFTGYESANREYKYKLFWRIGNAQKEGDAIRRQGKQAWTGVGKASNDSRRTNAQIRDREVRLIDLERLLPARNFSNSLLKKISSSSLLDVSSDVEKAFSYVFDIGEVSIKKIGSHINKAAYLINYQNEPYSSYNAASGEESLINILIDIFDSSENSLMLIDEIEAGFHPSVQRKLADIIQYVSWYQKKQFIITTHSPTLLAAFDQKIKKVY